MKPIIAVIIILFSYSNLNAQTTTDTIRINHRPIKNGYVLREEPNLIPGGVPSGAVTVYSGQDSVFSMSRGSIILLGKSENEINLVTELNGKQTFYFGFSRVVVKQGDTIEKGQFLGLLPESEIVNKFALAIKIKKQSKEFSRSFHLRQLIKADK